MAVPAEHAIVVGASMGGLVAAAALAPHVARVTVLDRDALPATPAPRRGVPQARHAHGLHPGGLRAMEDLLPGLTDRLTAGGAVLGDMSSQSEWFLGGGVLARGHEGTAGVGITRAFLEHHVRAMVSDRPGVTIRDGVGVARLVRRPGPRGRGQVTGVELDGGEQLEADLVVDASGRGSKTPAWLVELGYAAPVEEKVNCRMAYLTRRWRLANDTMGTDVISIVAPATTPHFGVIIAQEDGTYIVTLGGLLGQAPERTDAAYREFARRLPHPRIAAALDGAEPVTDLQPLQFPYSVRRRYDRLREFPEGLLVIGDAIASFNPMYGQGMSVAALEAVALREAVAGGRVNARRFFKKAHRIEDVAWKISTGGDLRFDAVEGRRTPDMKIMNAYLDRLTVAARGDDVLARQFLRVAGFLDRPESLFKPSVLRRVLRRPRPTAAGRTASTLTTAR